MTQEFKFILGVAGKILVAIQESGFSLNALQMVRERLVIAMHLSIPKDSTIVSRRYFTGKILLKERGHAFYGI